jgi:ribosomal protein S7
MKSLLAIYDPSPGQIELANKFVSVLMGRGKKVAAHRVLDQALKQVRKRLPSLVSTCRKRQRSGA